MKDEHIISLIESMPLASLSESHLTAIRAHAVDCVSCRRAFEAAQISSILLKERALESFEPPAFFHTRVMARLRERQAASGSWANNFWTLGRLWRTTGALAASMVATVVALGVLTFVIPGNQIGSEVSSLPTSYSAEEVILDQNLVAENLASDSQVLTAIYDAEEDLVR